MRPAVCIPVDDPSRVAEARRVVAAEAEKCQFDVTGAGRVSIVVTEAATNLLKHAGGGEILVHRLARGDAHGLEMHALDKGPGMANIPMCQEDGYSTAGSQGTGLGAIRRQSDWMDIYSVPGKGTAVVARLWAKAPPAEPAIEISGFSVPIRGETECGDAWAVHYHDRGCVLIAVDGLGHGPLAAIPAREALTAFKANPYLEPVRLLQDIHAALRSTRGAAGMVMALDTSAGTVEFAGVGNVAASILEDGKGKHAVSMGGILGQDVRVWRQFSYPWSRNSLLVVHSDGLSSRWNLSGYPGLALRSASSIAGVLYRDFGRKHDDATVLAARERRTEP